MQAKNDDDLHGGQRSSAVKYNICAMDTPSLYNRTQKKTARTVNMLIKASSESS